VGIHTDISWCDSTVNPMTGCSGCELWRTGMGGTCYAGKLHETRLTKSLPHLYAPTFTEVRLAPGRMVQAARWSDLSGKVRPDKPWLDGRPRHIFVGDMGDILSDAVPFEYLKSELIDVATSEAGSHHVWMVLTKRARRLVRFADHLNGELGISWPANIWPGTSITTQRRIGRGVTLALNFQRHYFLSVEPLLDAVDLAEIFEAARPMLVIVGGESGHDARRCDLAWIRKVIDQCRRWEVPIHIKQLGARASDEVNGIAGKLLRVHPDAGGVTQRLKDSHGGDIEEFPPDLRVRQFPEVDLSPSSITGDRAGGAHEHTEVSHAG
jgi:protein gp37